MFPDLRGSAIALCSSKAIINFHRNVETLVLTQVHIIAALRCPLYLLLCFPKKDSARLIVSGEVLVIIAFFVQM